MSEYVVVVMVPPQSLFYIRVCVCVCLVCLRLRPAVRLDLLGNSISSSAAYITIKINTITRSTFYNKFDDVICVSIFLYMINQS